jgi:hypothetical protein
MRKYRWSASRGVCVRSPAITVEIIARGHQLSLHSYGSASKVHRCWRNASSLFSPRHHRCISGMRSSPRLDGRCCINSAPSLSWLLAASRFAPGSVATVGQLNSRATAVAEPRCIAKVRCGGPLPPSVPCSGAARSHAAQPAVVFWLRRWGCA